MLLKYLYNPSSFVLLLAPPAWGKTSLILELYLKSERRFIFISPLKSINLEFYKRAKNLPQTYCLLKKEDIYHFLKGARTRRKDLLIISSELIDRNLFEFWESLPENEKPIFILDEFHLFYYWGESFRFSLWENCMGIANTGGSLLGLSATLSEALLEKWIQDFSWGMERGYLVDLGNQRFFNPPKKINYYPSFLRKFLIERFFYQLFDEKKYPGRFLYFCKTRNEVEKWIHFCRGKKIEVLGCVGGGVEIFQEELKASTPALRCIFATHALGHGVNLPSLNKIFISFQLNNIDFWLQMAARGGREKGSEYEIYSLDPFYLNLRERLYSVTLSLFFAVLRV